MQENDEQSIENPMSCDHSIGKPPSTTVKIEIHLDQLSIQSHIYIFAKL
jgi:hypothetical protein